MKKLLLIALLALSANLSAQIKTLPKGSVAAVTESYYDAAQEASSNGDLQYLQSLMDNGYVILTGKSIEVIILDYNMFSATKVRWKGTEYILWVDGSKLK